MPLTIHIFAMCSPQVKGQQPEPQVSGKWLGVAGQGHATVLSLDLLVCQMGQFWSLPGPL